jgi:predicted nucleotidyltransferase
VGDLPSLDAVRRNLHDVATELPDLKLLVLFGSAARGRSRADSDVDVAVLADGEADLDAAFLALAPRFRTSQLDLVDLRRAGPLLAFEVARSGILLVERAAGLFREFQSLAYRRFVDTKKLRDAQRRAIQVFLERRA